MPGMTAVEALKIHVSAALATTGKAWSIYDGIDGTTIDAFLSQEVVAPPAALLCFAGFTANPDLITQSRVLRYERRVHVYLLDLGDMQPAVDAILDRLNEKPEAGVQANNVFVDRNGDRREMMVISGDGIRLQLDGAPAYEIIITVQ